MFGNHTTLFNMMYYENVKMCLFLFQFLILLLHYVVNRRDTEMTLNFHVHCVGKVFKYIYILTRLCELV